MSRESFMVLHERIEPFIATDPDDKYFIVDVDTEISTYEYFGVPLLLLETGAGR